jgi:arylsulfatase A-like enzyme
LPGLERSAPLTPASPAVDALRDAAENANLVICVIDAARADHVGCYGYPRGTTTNIDALAQESLLFREHFSQYASTKPSVASLFTSQHADTHLAYENRPIDDATFTLAKGLHAAGFETVMFSSNPNAAPAMGLGLDFDEVYDQKDVEPLVKHWEKFTLPNPLLTLIEGWLKRRHRERFFAYIHFDPPHQPYLQPPEMTRLFAGKRAPNFVPGHFEFPVGDRKTLESYAHPPLPEWINLYDANLRFADWAVGELTRLLRETGALDNTVLIITSDHGEAFGEHGYLWHERGVYDELVHIPLLIRMPGTPRNDFTALTQTIDLLPTIFDLYGIAYPSRGIQGTSLLPLIAGLEDTVHDHVISRSDGQPPSYLVRSQNWSLILWGNGTWRALYSVRSDPGQRRNVLADHPGVAKTMLGQFRRFARTQRRPPLEFLDPGIRPLPLPETGNAPLTAEDQKRLRALGYLR